MSARAIARRMRRHVRAIAGRDVRTGLRTRQSSLRLGSAYGGWDVLPALISPSSVVYSFGIGDDVSWDLEIIQRFGARVDAFDPTPRSVRWVQSQVLPKDFVFHSVGLADFDGEAQFVMKNEHPEWSSYNLVHSRAETIGAFETVTAPVQRLRTIMDRLGHNRIDVLKIDIEGAEYDVLSDILRSRIYSTQLLVEFHYFDDPIVRLGQTEQMIRRLNDVGYRAFARSPIGYEFSFVRD